jgi:hypothetical protein
LIVLKFNMERCESGLISTLGKREYFQRYRRLESLPLRQIYKKVIIKI